MRPHFKGLSAHLAALAIGGAGGLLALGLGFPAAALVGASLAVALAATLGARLAVHPRLRDLAFTVIGVSLGAGVEREALHQIGSWSISLVMLLASLAATLLLGTALLRRGFGMDAETALLASSPGTMSNALALALEGRGDATVILILQMMRLLFLVTVVPIGALALGSGPVSGPVAAMGLGSAIPLVLAALAAGLAASRAGVPAACLLSGMVLSALAHVAGLAQGPAPTWVVDASFVITGAALGARLSAITGAQLWRLSTVGLLLVLCATLISLVFSVLTHLMTGLPLAQVWIAFAPGGVEAMAAIGLALGHDPAYVATHHFARILALILAIPLVLRRIGDRP